MRFPHVPFWLMLLLLPVLTYAQTSSGSIEGVVVDYVSGNHSDTTTVEARGKSYLFCLGCPGSIKDSPQIIGGNDIRVRTRVRVTYAKLTRSKDGGEFYIKALRVVNLSNQSRPKGPSTGSADETWTSFWQGFRAAVMKRDRAALKKLMTNPFDSGGGGDYSPDKWIRFLDERKAWGHVQKSVASGTRPFEEYSRSIGKPSRVTNRKHLIFVFSNGRWRWASVMGD